MHKYLPGDKVRVSTVRKYGIMVDSMAEEYGGKVVTIKRNLDNDRYEIEEDGGCWCWDDNCFTALVEESKWRSLKPGDILIMKNDVCSKITFVCFHYGRIVSLESNLTRVHKLENVVGITGERNDNVKPELLKDWHGKIRRGYYSNGHAYDIDFHCCYSNYTQIK